MVSRGRHPRKEIAEALARAESAGLLVKEDHNGHRWGEMTCERCHDSRIVWSTPENSGTHAKQIHRFTAKHRH